jgi:hypothetical protein
MGRGGNNHRGATLGRSKFGAVKTTIDGITFDSKAEARRYGELKTLLELGLIIDLELQPRYELQPAYKKAGKTVRAIDYIADFRYRDRTGRVIIEDVKGMETAVFKLKKKMFEYRYPEFTLTLVK